jgi:hypothetical protein
MCDAFEGVLRDRDRYRATAIVGYALGGAAAIGTVVLAVWPKKPFGRSSAVRVTPILSPAQSGVVVNGAF